VACDHQPDWSGELGVEALSDEDGDLAIVVDFACEHCGECGTAVFGAEQFPAFQWGDDA